MFFEVRLLGDKAMRLLGDEVIETKKHSPRSASLRLWISAIGYRILPTADRIVLLADHDFARSNLAFLVLEEDVEECTIGLW